MNLNYIPSSQPMSAMSTGRTSPGDYSAPGGAKPPFGPSNGLNNTPGSMGTARLGAGSPSHELGTRLYSKR